MRSKPTTTRPLVSVVTVTYMDLRGLTRTLESLRPLVQQAGSEIEVLVIDGGSGPHLASIRKHFPWATVRSEPDEGIYDAMNAGLALARGDFVWFLNGGDECSIQHWTQLAAELEEDRGKVVLFHYVLSIGTRRIDRRPRRSSYIWHGLPTSHQAIFYPRESAAAVGYDLSYRIVGDYQLTAQLIKAGIATTRSRLTVAVFYSDGVSTQQSHRVAAEARRVQREILVSPFLLRCLSSIRHFASRTARRCQRYFLLRLAPRAAERKGALQ